MGYFDSTGANFFSCLIPCKLDSAVKHMLTRSDDMILLFEQYGQHTAADADGSKFSNTFDRSCSYTVNPWAHIPAYPLRN